MFVFTTSFSLDDVQRAAEKMKANTKTSSQLSARSKQILQAVSFSSQEISRAASTTGLKRALPARFPVGDPVATFSKGD